MIVKEFLQQQKVPFNELKHPTTYDAQRLAHSLDVPGDNVAKTVVLKADGRYVVAVLQATHSVEFDKAAAALGAERAELASEEEFKDLFPDCELGAVPPFGSRFDLITLVDESLTEDEYIVFEGNKHDEAISMRYQDYAKLEQPRVASFTRHI